MAFMDVMDASRRTEDGSTFEFVGMARFSRVF